MWEFVSALLVCFLVVFIFAFLIKVVVETLRVIVLWLTGAKDFAELGKRFDENTARVREANLQRRARRLGQRHECGFPLTLRGRLSLEWWRLKKSFAHPIRYCVAASSVFRRRRTHRRALSETCSVIALMDASRSGAQRSRPSSVASSSARL
jgi:hypothetical protein